jgi:glycosyltransferase involved in cell wall biosynthesis
MTEIETPLSPPDLNDLEELPSAELAHGAHSGPLFTVFTPTRDRAHTLRRVYDSLRAQTLRDFEWLVIDNDSSDGTEALIEGWRAEADFPIRYYRQPNRGLTVSWNRGVREAAGQFFLALASDDSCVPETLERFLHHWQTIPPDQRARYSGVAALCQYEDGTLAGEPFPRSPMDSDALELAFRWKVGGEKWGFQRTDVMRRFPFPVIDDYLAYIPESIVWRAIAREYRERYVNEVLRVFWNDEPSSLARPKVPWANAPGAALEARIFLDHDAAWFRYAPLKVYMKAARYARWSFHLGLSAVDQAGQLSSPTGRLLWLAALPFGWLMYFAERRGLRPRFLPTRSERHLRATQRSQRQ